MWNMAISHLPSIRHARLQAITKLQIDAVAMVRAIRDTHYELLKDKTPEERIAFYREKAQQFHPNLPSVKAPVQRQPSTLT